MKILFSLILTPTTMYYNEKSEDKPAEIWNIFHSAWIKEHETILSAKKEKKDWQQNMSTFKRDSKT